MSGSSDLKRRGALQISPCQASLTLELLQGGVCEVLQPLWSHSKNSLTGCRIYSLAHQNIRVTVDRLQIHSENAFMNSEKVHVHQQIGGPGCRLVPHSGRREEE